MENRKSRIDTAYMVLSGDDRLDRACKNIPDSSCTDLPLNYVLNVVNGTASKLAEQVASAKLALPWLLSVIGAPASLVGFLMPLRQAGTQDVSYRSGRSVKTHYLSGLRKYRHRRGHPDLWFPGGFGPNFRHPDTDCGPDGTRSHRGCRQLFPAGSLKGLAS